MESVPDNYAAHIANDGKIQTVSEHCRHVAALAGQFAEPFQAENQAKAAGLAHDIGKYSDDFQDHIKGKPGLVDHSTAGAVELLKLEQSLEAICAALACMGHHAGLPDMGYPADNETEPTFNGRLKRRLPDYKAFQTILSLLPPGHWPGQDTGGMSNYAWSFYTRMISSCLTDADFLDTEAFFQGQPRPKLTGNLESMLGIARKTADGYRAKPNKSALNQRRCDIMDACQQAGQRILQPGLFTMTVPTGGGKTFASVLFALEHAAKCGLRRIIYVVPYLSIIEQNAQLFRDMFGGDCVLEHHSNKIYDMTCEDTRRMALATENWDAPLVVTTAVQFFESLHAYRPGQCRKLHNIAGSALVFDEAQMLPLHALYDCVRDIEQLTRRYHCSAILCTATQPALEPIFRQINPQISVTELCPEVLTQGPVFDRVTFQNAGHLDEPALAQKLGSEQQVLCIINTRKLARNLFQQISGSNAYHLSTLMYPVHRQRVLSTIRRALDSGQHCRVISTSLIEAGVDVDFPTEYREFSGLDSILQAAGRCNRNAGPIKGRVYLFQSDEPVPTQLQKNLTACRTALQCNKPLNDPETIERYFKELRKLAIGNRTQNRRTWKDMDFRQEAAHFHMITEGGESVFIPLEPEAAALMQRIQSGEATRRDYRLIGRYSVQVYDNQIRKLKQQDAIVELPGNILTLKPERGDLYDNNTGLLEPTT